MLSSDNDARMLLPRISLFLNGFILDAYQPVGHLICCIIPYPQYYCNTGEGGSLIDNLIVMEINFCGAFCVSLRRGARRT